MKSVLNIAFWRDSEYLKEEHYIFIKFTVETEFTHL